MMTDQSIVKTVTMDEAVLQSGYESDEQDQIDVEADEVVVNESLISLLNQKTITLSSKVDTVELEKAKQSQYEYTGVEGDNFVMRFIGRIVRSLVSVSPENQKDVDELIDYSRGRFKDRNLEQIYSSANRSGNLLQDIATSCVALIAGFVNARFHSIYTIGIPITLTVQILILASAVLVLMGLSWIPFVQSGQMSLISCLYYLQPFLQIELFIAIVCTSLDIGVPIIPEDEARRFDMQHKQSNKSVGDNNQEISTLSLVNSNSSAQIYTGSNQINE
ncbi:hypothetical protein MIR68_001454 [Amoeboaphelidium protococcarum]|nr:hypothetical protein MIR68_001454 [Amoeboaphelidium protococcarum]